MKRQLLSVVIAAAALAPGLAQAVILGQVDTFEIGTTNGWTDGAGGSNVVNIASGGPAGADDNYLQLSSGIFGGASRLITYNRLQWLGNYGSAGVTSVAMDLKLFGVNPSESSIPIRIALRDGTGGADTPGYSSTTPFDLPNDGAWHHAVFSLADGNLSPLYLPPPLATLLADLSDFRLLSSIFPATIGDVISARVGVDNIAAVPEPAAMVTAMTAIVAGWFLRRRWRVHKR